MYRTINPKPAQTLNPKPYTISPKLFNPKKEALQQGFFQTSRCPQLGPTSACGTGGRKLRGSGSRLRLTSKGAKGFVESYLVDVMKQSGLSPK